jgi:formate hydrogenlyase transcriptional activator
MTALRRYAWPGNVRELEHVIERAVILCDGPELDSVDWLSSSIPDSATAGTPITLEALERRHILETLEQTEWKVSGPNGAAAILGLKPTTLEARMKKLVITRSGRTT